MDSILGSVAPPAAVMGPEERPVPFAGSAGQDPEAGAHTEVLSWNRPEQALARIARGDVAAIIMEAAMCNSGAIMPLPRSEEHTSELQSLMRISYAVFCLKKKKTHTRTQTKQKT